MTFKEYFERKYGKLEFVWGSSGEIMSEVQLRFMDTMAEYLDSKASPQSEPKDKTMSYMMEAVRK